MRIKNMEPEDLKKLRNELGLSVSKAALQCHITPRTWGRYEAGDRAIPEGVIHLFCILNGLDHTKYLSQ
ncbi:hypothetical protein MNBD_GAMMA25-182 [hydrothermal vent metagenome]|uniref:HTH cro/C1-type domain-containing protein n=1 Tax=hydrothermal vent metagenome TaxID=652676 RepID=A0A3B1ATM0_9ZZZZ